MVYDGMVMKNYFLECDGNLFDTRKPNWYKLPPLRPNYAKIKSVVANDNAALKAAIRQHYAYPGGYELFGICSDGAVLCCDCMRSEYYLIAYSRKHKINDGWRVVAIDCAANYDSLIQCEHCYKVIVDDWQSEETN